MECPLTPAKAVTSWLQSQPATGIPASPIWPATARDNKSEESRQATCIGKSLSFFDESPVWLPAEESLDNVFTPSLPGQQQPVTTFGKRLLDAKEPSSSSVNYPSIARSPEIGSECGSVLLQDAFSTSLQIFVCRVTGLSEQLALTTLHQLEWSELATYSGVKLAVASRGAPGKKRDWKLTLKIQEPSSGVATKVKRMLSLMNFEVVLTSVTSSGGWTVTQLSWRSKVPAVY